MNEFLKALTVKDDVEKYLSLWKAFWLTIWMCMDHIQWLQKAGYLKLVDLKKIDGEAQRGTNGSKRGGSEGREEEEEKLIVLVAPSASLYLCVCVYV